jgi:hypothetical protein
VKILVLRRRPSLHKEDGRTAEKPGNAATYQLVGDETAGLREHIGQPGVEVNGTASHWSPADERGQHDWPNHCVIGSAAAIGAAKDEIDA